MKLRDQWDKWGWLLALLVFSLFTLRMLWGRNAFCATTSEHCFREWLAALGSWAAIPAAVVTVFMLSKQISEAREYNKLVTKITLSPEKNQAIHVFMICRARTNLIENVFIDAAQSTAIDTINSVHTLIDDTIETLQREEIISAIARYGMPNTSKASVDHLTMFNDQIVRIEHVSQQATADYIIENFEFFFKTTKVFIESLEKRAWKAAEDYDALINSSTH